MQIPYSKRLSGWLKHNLPDLILILIIAALCIFVAVKNYTGGTWLLGWDDLVPELNFKLNIGRSLSAAWQEYQGLGLLGGMGHAADLPRQLILWLFSLFVQTPFLRYLWAFLMLILGPLGTYLIVSRGLFGDRPSFASRSAAMASAVFYLFNLATVQTFYTPFETFIGFYGFLPWLLFTAISYLKRGGRGRLLVFFAVSLLGAGAFYVQTLFVVYAVFLSVFALETIAVYKKPGLLRSFKLALTTLAANAFWLLPVLYFSLTSAGVPGNSHINTIATPETQLMNQARADFVDIASLKGYWFDYYDWDKNGNYSLLYKSWIDYTSQPLVQKASIALFAVSVLGLILSLLKKKTSYGFSFLALLAFSFFMLDGGTIPKVPYFTEIFRNAYTKWANSAAFIYSIGLGFCVFIISDLFRNKIKIVLGTLVSTLLIAGSVLSAAPILRGGLIADAMRVNLPSYYPDTINYFKAQDPTKRIADFPITDF